MSRPLLVKLGGVLLESEEALARLFDVLAIYRKSAQRPVVLLHGGGCLVDDLLKRLGLTAEKIDGLRVTPAEHIGVITGALAGTANKILLAQAIKRDIAAVGLCLADGGMVHVTQRDDMLGHVGEAHPGSPQLINALLAADFLPVVSSIGVTRQGELMNVNADQAATALAATLSADLIMLTDVSSILNGKGERIAEISAATAQQLIKQGIITGGMTVKVNAALAAARTLERPVEIAGWRQADRLFSLFNGVSVGTRVIA